MSVTGIVLAGGKSSRMGRNKALLSIEGKQLIQRTIETLEGIVDDVIIVANDQSSYDFLNVPIVPDILKDKGPLAGLQAGLRASSTEMAVIIACDMPFICPEVIRFFMENSDGYDAVVPKINDRLHPLFALYKKSVLPTIDGCLEKDERRIRHFLSKLRVNYVDENDLQKMTSKNIERIFFNMNYPEDYENATKVER